MTAPFSSTKQAIACAADPSRMLGYQRAKVDLWCPTCKAHSCDQDHELVYRRRETSELEHDIDAAVLPSLVRAALTEAGIDPDGEEAADLYAWATTSDEASEVELRAEALDLPLASVEAVDLHARADRAARVMAAQQRVWAVLVEHGLIRQPPAPIRAIPIGWRVMEGPDGSREVFLVTDPSTTDDGIYLGPGAEARAHRVAQRADDGPVSRWEVVETIREPELRLELLPRWRAGVFPALSRLDAEIAGRLGCTARWARTVRASWGVVGSRGRSPTTPTPGSVGS